MSHRADDPLAKRRAVLLRIGSRLQGSSEAHGRVDGPPGEVEIPSCSARALVYSRSLRRLSNANGISKRVDVGRNRALHVVNGLTGRAAPHPSREFAYPTPDPAAMAAAVSINRWLVSPLHTRFVSIFQARAASTSRGSAHSFTVKVRPARGDVAGSGSPSACASSVVLVLFVAQSGRRHPPPKHFRHSRASTCP